MEIVFTTLAQGSAQDLVLCVSCARLVDKLSLILKDLAGRLAFGQSLPGAF
jgi:hypothetical protein